MERDRELASSLAAMASGAAVISLVPSEALTDERRTKLAEGEKAEASITPLTSHDDEQGQRGTIRTLLSFPKPKLCLNLCTI
jgi:hypothetical protein